MTDTTNQRTLSGQKVKFPECHFEDCSDESTCVFILRGLEIDKTYRCDNEEHKPYWKGPGGIEEVRTVDPAKNAINTEGENRS